MQASRRVRFHELPQGLYRILVLPGDLQVPMDTRQGAPGVAVIDVSEAREVLVQVLDADTQTEIPEARASFVTWGPGKGLWPLAEREHGVGSRFHAGWVAGHTARLRIEAPGYARWEETNDLSGPVIEVQARLRSTPTSRIRLELRDRGATLSLSGKQIYEHVQAFNASGELVRMLEITGSGSIPGHYELPELMFEYVGNLTLRVDALPGFESTFARVEVTPERTTPLIVHLTRVR